MVFWTHSGATAPSSSKWSEKVGMPDDSSEHRASSETSSTPVTSIPPEYLLPVPVIQGPGLTIGKGKTTNKSARIGAPRGRGLPAHWATFKKRFGTSTAPSTSSMIGGDSSAEDSTHPRPAMDDEKEDVDEVIVDRIWSEEIKSSVAHSDIGGSPEKSNSHLPAGTSINHDSSEHVEGFWAVWSPWVFIRWRLWPMLMEFFTSRFSDVKAEAHYRKENWFMRKVRPSRCTAMNQCLITLCSVLPFAPPSSS